MGTAFRMIVKEEGMTALYKGAIPRMVVVGPLFGITLLAFEAQKAYMIKNGLLQIIFFFIFVRHHTKYLEVFFSSSNNQESKATTFFLM